MVKFASNATQMWKDSHLQWLKSIEKRGSGGDLIRGIRHEFSLGFSGYSAVLEADIIESLQQNAGVKSVTEVTTSPPSTDFGEGIEIEAPGSQSLFLDVEKADANDTAVVTDLNKGWNFNRVSHRQTTPGYNPGPWVHNGFLGQGVSIYLLDTGLKLGHPGWRGSDVSSLRNFVSGTREDDVNGHGTLCGGTIAGKNGMAPKAKLYSVKIANDRDISACDDVVAGIQYVVSLPAPANNLKIISMSQYGFTGQPDVSAAVSAAVAAGVHVVVCAGNDQRDACDVEPANARGVISVGSIDAYDKFPTRRDSPEGTNLGRCITIFGPGNRVPTLSHENLSLTYQYFGWGTSVAAPQTAAVMANRMSEVGPMTPAAMLSWLQEVAIRGQIEDSLRGSPNLILFNGVGEA
ncbi:hypothetical protein LTS18_005576 [Coniosporium uncinatum]|uniref:Uncharacterized protein n=1 Tax=Coniosporium uncinatum TaxID=93489 RepID=A0ACC3DY24_9PEZI|nr:hypothetical protein LTS18_005576 [Coniosporium uncinatum]